MNTELPPLFLERLKKILPDKWLSLCLETFSQSKVTTFRTNTLKIRSGELAELLANEGFKLSALSKFENIFLVPDEQRKALTYSIYFDQGLFYIQNPSSVIPVLALDPQPNEEILDLAAAPGGKTIHIAECMNNQGRIAAVEAVKSRFFRLKANLQKYGVINTQIYLKDGSVIWRLCKERFDRVLLDAPCSTEAKFNTENPESFAYWNLRKINEMSRKQKKLIYSAIQALKPGGTLIYCTCSFAPEENEMIINEMLQKFEGALQIEEIPIPITNKMPGMLTWKEKKFSPLLQKALRILPDNIMDGFFICKLKKVKSTI